MSKPIVEAVVEFLQGCPHLEKLKAGLSVDFMKEKPGKPPTFVIESVPVNPIIRSYIGGSARKQFVFVFASKEWYGRDIVQNIKNIGFYEDFSAWLDEQSRNRNLPVLEDGKKALSIKALTTPFIIDNEIDKARYQIQCRLEYFEPAAN